MRYHKGFKFGDRIIWPPYGAERCTCPQAVKAYEEEKAAKAAEEEAMAETIAKVLYPEDNHLEGKSLRLKQQYFFVSASLHDAIRVFYPGQDKPDLTTFPNKIVFQLNDTHPVIGIPELMRILIDEYGYDWDTAWSITTKTFNYTCHTLLPEALEVWPASLIGELLPRHLEIIEKINAQLKKLRSEAKLCVQILEQQPQIKSKIEKAHEVKTFETERGKENGRASDHHLEHRRNETAPTREQRSSGGARSSDTVQRR